MFTVGNLEIHAAHACNLRCESCSHFSSSGHRGVLTPEEGEAWMQPWKDRLRPRSVRILGGEPTLNPRLGELIQLAHRSWPASTLVLVTNGFFLHQHPQLPEILAETRTELQLSIHGDDLPYRQKLAQIGDLLSEWRRKYPLVISVERALGRWTRRYHGWGMNVLPFEDDDPQQSWSHCFCRHFRQLFRGMLWKCSPIAYLHLQKETFPGISSKWDRYLAYQPLSPDCSDQRLQEFLSAEAEDICRMCAANPQLFKMPSPLSMPQAHKQPLF